MGLPHARPLPCGPAFVLAVFGPSERGYSGFGIFLDVLERLGLGGVPLQDLDG